MKNTPHKFLSLLVMLTLLFSSFGAINVYADDATPVPEATEEAVVEEGSPEVPPESQATEEAAANPTEETGETEPDPTEAAGEESDEGTPEATEEAAEPTEEPTGEATGEATEEATGEPTEEADPTEEPKAEPTPMLPDEDLDTLPEILENVPEGTEIVVLDEDGNAASLASEEAAETLVEGDPIWCPSGSVPGDPQCTPSFTSFSALIAELSSGGYSGVGTIWVAENYDPNQDPHQIRFDADPIYNAQTNPDPLNNLGDLIIQGGWNGQTGVNADITGTSTIGVSMVFLNWVTNLTFNDLVFKNEKDNNGFGLRAATTGTVTMDNVKADGSTGTNTGAMITADGDITISDSTFNNNGRFGLMAWSSAGNIVLTNVTASGNAYTGAYLDTCDGSTTTGLCDSSGNITINTASTGTTEFSNNGYDGLHIVSGGSTTLTDVVANNNSQRGLNFFSWSDGGSGIIDINNNEFIGNGGTGMYISQYADGDITIDDTTVAVNRIGAQIYSTRGSGTVRITNSTFAESTYTGLHVESTGNIFLTGSTAGSLGTTYAGNRNNGAYLISSGDITVASSTFNDNVQTSSPADPGLYAKAGGNIHLSNIYANNNLFGSGAVLQTTGTGDIDIDTLSEFNNNGIFGLQANITNGTLTLNEVTANLNTVKGAYLNANGLSDIEISNSTFTENGNYGVYTSTAEGNIFVIASDFDGNNITSIGAKLVSSQGGDIEVISSTFSENEIGLYAVGEANVTLTDITSTDNTSHDVILFSTFTQKGCYCAGDENTSIIATINDGTFSNSPVGIYAKPGEEGSVTFTGTQDYTLATEPYILDTEAIPLCSDCGCTKEEKESKSYNMIEVPFSGSGNVPQQCDIYSGTVMQMENGVVVKVRCPFEGFSNLQGVNFSDLPGVLDEEMFDMAILLGLLGDDGSFVLNSDGTITITFSIPETSRGRDHRLLFWDTDANDGEGSWVEMPPYETGTSFMLHPEDPDDPRMINSGVVDNGSTLSITVNFAGYFVVVGQ